MRMYRVFYRLLLKRTLNAYIFMKWMKRMTYHWALWHLSDEPEHKFNQMLIIDKILSDDVNYSHGYYSKIHALYSFKLRVCFELSLSTHANVMHDN